MKGWEIRQKLKPGYKVKIDWDILKTSSGKMHPSGDMGIPSGWHTVEGTSRKRCECEVFTEVEPCNCKIL